MNRLTKGLLVLAACGLAASAATAQTGADPTDEELKVIMDVEKALKQSGGDFPKMVRETMPAGRIQDSWAGSRPGAAMREERYDPLKEIKVRAREGAHTVVALPEWERVRPESVMVGSKDALKVELEPKGIGNRVVILPAKSGYDSTVSIMGESGRIYALYVMVENDRSKTVPDFVVYVDARQPMNWQPPEPAKRGNDGRAKDYLNELPFEAAKAQINYEMKGDAEIAPRFVVSDGVLTFLFYDDINRIDLPAVNRVVDQVDRPVNTRRQGNVLVVESPVGEGLTLRAGQKVVCVRKNGKASTPVALRAQ